MKLPDDLLLKMGRASAGDSGLVKYGVLLILLSVLGGLGFGIYYFYMGSCPPVIGCNACGMG